MCLLVNTEQMKLWLFIIMNINFVPLEYDDSTWI